jgi:signal transduction histidine kinase
MEINILIVDDLKSTLYTLEALLESIDTCYNISMASSGPEALEIVEKEEIDLIILDLQMPEIDGFEVAQSLKSNKRTVDIPVVFLTASSKLRTEGLALGAVDYLTKPIDEDQFISKISLYSRLVKSIKENRLKDKQIQQQARIAQMAEMISMIAHQWRQPLAAIASNVINLQIKQELGTFDLDTKEGQEESKRFFLQGFKNIEKYVQNLTTTIDDFRNFYKPNKESVVTTLEDIVTKALGIIKNSIDTQGIDLIFDCQSKEEIRVYDSDIMQVILNILKNSRDNFIDKKIENPEIKITVKDNMISVCDNGGGIQEDIIEKIFDPYFSTKNDKNGTGLGLYMSKIVIEDHHNGHLYASNNNDTQGVNTGACFIVELGKIPDEQNSIIF